MLAAHFGCRSNACANTVISSPTRGTNMERDSLCDSMLIDKMGHILILDGNTDLDLQTCWNFALLRQVTTQAIKNLFRLGRFGQAIVEKGTGPHATTGELEDRRRLFEIGVKIS